MLLAQTPQLGITAGNTADLGLQANTAAQTTANVARMSLILLLPLLGILMLVFWIVALVQVISRNDLKLNKWWYIAALFIVAPIGMLFYFFGENRKKLGWAMVIIYVLITILAIL